LPLFFIQGSYQYGLGLGTAQFWLYMIDKVPQSILMTWICNNNQQSTLSAILLHFMVNLIGELFGLTLTTKAASTMITRCGLKAGAARADRPVLAQPYR
jgi:hypothetical protein